MKIYLCNISRRYFPDRGVRRLIERGHEVAGNLLEFNIQKLETYSPDIIIYSPLGYHHVEANQDILILTPDITRKIPTIIWVLYPDEVLGWSMTENTYSMQLAEHVNNVLESCIGTLANSFYMKRLLEAVVPECNFEVCYLGIDTLEIDKANKRIPSAAAKTVLWHHRWSDDKNFRQALTIVLQLAPAHRSTTFFLGRREDWDPPWHVSDTLIDFYRSAEDQILRLPNIVFAPRLDGTEEYWEFLSKADIAFSCSFHESFGVAMLEQAYAGAACVVPNREVYPEVHSGALVVDDAQMACAIERLIELPSEWRAIAESSRNNASRYDMKFCSDRLLEVIWRLVG